VVSPVVSPAKRHDKNHLGVETVSETSLSSVHSATASFTSSSIGPLAASLRIGRSHAGVGDHGGNRGPFYRSPRKSR
jgi:hypothetical protein